MTLAWRRCMLRVECSSSVRPRFRQEAGCTPPMVSALPLPPGKNPDGGRPARRDSFNPQEIPESPMASAGLRISGEAVT
jgi:hypothetical protein